MLGVLLGKVTSHNPIIHLIPTLQLNLCSGYEIHLIQWHRLCPEQEFMANNHGQEQDQADVVRKEFASIPFNKHLKATGNDDQWAEEQTIPG